MPNIQKSLRLPENIVRAIDLMAMQTGKDFSTMTKELLEEAIKMQRCPGIVFSEGTRGRRARIAGTGIEVWELIANYKSVGEDFEELQIVYHWLSELQLRAALGYYRTYSEEIDALIARNASWSPEHTFARYPFLSGSRQ